MGFRIEPEPERIPSSLLAEQIHLRCTWCRDRLVRAEGVFCAECLAPHHPECRAEHGCCAAPGCGSAHILEPAERTRRGGRALRIAAGLAIGLVAAGVGGLVAAGVGGWVTAREDAHVGARVRARSSDAEAHPDGDVGARVRARSSETETDRGLRFACRLATDGFVSPCDLEPGDRLLFRSWDGAREVIRIPAADRSQVILIAPPTAAIAVSHWGVSFRTVTSEETCVLEIDATGWGQWRTATEADLRRADQR